MPKVFISGSMHIKKIDKKVIDHVNSIINSKNEVIIGDADGVDSSIQNYLKDMNFKTVTIYCTGSAPRNNIGRWPVKKIVSSEKPGTRAFFTAKDIQMSEDCDFGLMVWDAKSTGTLSNVLQLLRQQKKSMVFVNKKKEFYEITDVQSFENLLSVMSENAITKADEKIRIRSKIKDMKKAKQLQLFE